MAAPMMTAAEQVAASEAEAKKRIAQYEAQRGANPGYVAGRSPNPTVAQLGPMPPAITTSAVTATPAAQVSAPPAPVIPRPVGTEPVVTDSLKQAIGAAVVAAGITPTQPAETPVLGKFTPPVGVPDQPAQAQGASPMPPEAKERTMFDNVLDFMDNLTVDDIYKYSARKLGMAQWIARTANDVQKRMAGHRVAENMARNLKAAQSSGSAEKVRQAIFDGILSGIPLTNNPEEYVNQMLKQAGETLKSFEDYSEKVLAAQTALAKDASATERTQMTAASRENVAKTGAKARVDAANIAAGKTGTGTGEQAVAKQVDQLDKEIVRIQKEYDTEKAKQPYSPNLPGIQKRIDNAVARKNKLLGIAQNEQATAPSSGVKPIRVGKYDVTVRPSQKGK